MTDFSLCTRPSLPLAGAQSPFSVSPTSYFIDGHAGHGSGLLILNMPFLFFFAVALALREQVLTAGEVPVGTNDVSVEMIVTPDETIVGTGDSSTSRGILPA
jgi:hypothetical protein